MEPEPKGDAMRPIDAKIIAGFLLNEQEQFFDYLDQCSIDPTEGTIMIEEMIGASQGGIPTCIEQFSGFVGE
jgi:L-rhamnose isomerase